MSRILFFAALLFTFIVPNSAFAGPEGVYYVEGTNPGNKGRYSGTVTVERNGDTYTVAQDIDGSQYIGTGLGAANVKGNFTIGPANEGDIALAVSYISGESFGQAFYIHQEDGSWKGIWAYGGAKKIGSETWTPQ